MLEDARLHVDELRRKLIVAAGDITNQYFFLGGEIVPDFDDCGLKNYVSVDKDGNIVGYICYRYDATTRRVHSFGAINFTGNHLTFGVDMMALLKRLFLVYNARTVEFRAIEDNPANRSYRRVIEDIGGAWAGTLHDVFMSSDGTVHNMNIYEVSRYSYTYMLTGSKSTTVGGRTAKFEEAVFGSRINKLEESPCTKFWCYQDYISVERLKELGVFRYGLNYTPLVIEGDRTPIAEMRHQLFMRGVKFATLVGQASPTRFVVMHRGV